MHSLFLRLLVLTSFLLSGTSFSAGEEIHNHRVCFKSYSKKHIGIQCGSIKRVLKCNQDGCQECKRRNCPSEISINIDQATMFKIAHGSIAWLDKNGYLPKMSTTQFIGVETGAAIGMFSGAVACLSKGVQDRIAVFGGLGPSDEAISIDQEHLRKTGESAVNASSDVANNPVTKSVIDGGVSLVTGSIPGLFGAATNYSKYSKDAATQDCLKTYLEAQKELSAKAKVELMDIFKVGKVYGKPNQEDIIKWQEKHKEQLTDNPTHFMETIPEKQCSYPKRLASDAFSAAGNTASFCWNGIKVGSGKAFQTMRKYPVIAAGTFLLGSTTVAVGTVTYYYITAEDKCQIDPEGLNGYYTVVELTDGSLYGIRLAVYQDVETEE